MRPPPDPAPVMLMRVIEFGLAPATEFDEQRFRLLRRGEIVRVLLPEPGPNEAMRRGFHAALHKLAEAIGEPKEVLRRRLKIETKHIDAIVREKDGAMRIAPASEATMSDEAYREYVQTIAAHVAEKYGVDFMELGKSATNTEKRT